MRAFLVAVILLCLVFPQVLVFLFLLGVWIRSRRPGAGPALWVRLE